MKPLNEKQKRHLKALAHPRKPVLIVGNAGVTEALLKELDATLEHHELIKVRVNAIDREERDAMIAALCEGSGSLLVQRIGHIAVLYRPAQKPQLILPRE
jgi:RNA-binding protein